MDYETQMGEKESAIAFHGQYPRIEMREMPSDEEKMAERLGVTLEQLPVALMEAKQQLDEYARQVNRFAETFKTQPVSRRHRRAQKFGHRRLYG